MNFGGDVLGDTVEVLVQPPDLPGWVVVDRVGGLQLSAGLGFLGGATVDNPLELHLGFFPGISLICNGILWFLWWVLVKFLSGFELTRSVAFSFLLACDFAGLPNALLVGLSLEIDLVSWLFIFFFFYNNFVFDIFDRRAFLLLFELGILFILILNRETLGNFVITL